MNKIQQLNVRRNQRHFNDWSNLLERSNLNKERNLDYVCGIYEEDRLIATGAVSRNVIKCVAVCKDATGGSIISQLISHLEGIIYQSYDNVYLYTTPKSAPSFKHLGYTLLAAVENQLVFMEKAVQGLDDYLRFLKTHYQEGKSIGAIVMNANPFTNGHLHLVEYAHTQVDHLFIFVVSEDISKVSFKDRFHLVKEGTKHLANITVLETRSYMVSQQTFPSYLLSENAEVTSIHATLDAKLFTTAIAPILNIKYRFVGTEPHSQATNIYNQRLKSVFGEDIELIEIPRKEEDKLPISASRVRDLWESEDLESIKRLVPKTTYQFIHQKIKE